MAEDDFEIGDVENFGGAKDEQFSHSLLVMSAMRKCLDAGAKEMRDGWYNERTDRMGNKIKTYIEDTKKAFIESVRSCLMIMACDLDIEAEGYIDELLKDIENKKKELIKKNDDSWNNLSRDEKMKHMKSLGVNHILGTITHPTLKQELNEYELDVYRSIFAELGKLTKRLDFYKAEMFIA